MSPAKAANGKQWRRWGKVDACFRRSSARSTSTRGTQKRLSQAPRCGHFSQPPYLRRGRRATNGSRVFVCTVWLLPYAGAQAGGVTYIRKEHPCCSGTVFSLCLSLYSEAWRESSTLAKNQLMGKSLTATFQREAILCQEFTELPQVNWT